MSAKTVFISYSHDSPAHSARVLAFAMALRDDGIEVELDQFHADEIIDWPRWCNEQTSRERSDFVLCVSTAEYYRRIEGNVPPESGKGVYWEGNLLDDDLYDAKGNHRLIPILFDDEPETSIPRFLRGWTFCRLRNFGLTDSGYEHAIRIFTRQARVVKKPLGKVPVLPQQSPSRPSRGVRQSEDRSRGHKPETSVSNPTAKSTVIGIEFIADGPLSEFDETRWVAALQDLLGKDVSKVRIASIRKGSTVVRVLGDPEVIARALERLRTSPETSRDFQASTGLRSYSGVLANKAAEQIFGRSEELSQLDLAWAEHKTHVLTIIGFGGVGKSYLIAYWMARLAVDGWRGAERVFDWSFYSQGTREQGTVSADAFIAAALKFFGDGPMAQSSASPWDKGARLAQLIAQERTLVVLDGLEPLQHPPGPLAGELKDPALAALLKGLAKRNPGLCIVTSRERVEDLKPFRDTTAQEWQLQHLSTSAAVDLLKTLGVRGSAAEFQRLAEEVKGHALTLNLLGRYLAKAHQGDIRKSDQLNFGRADTQIPGGHAFKTIAAYERWLAEAGEDNARVLAVLRLLGLFDRPADADCLTALRREPPIPGLTEPLIGLSDNDWTLCLSSLADSGLILLKGGQYAVDAHPLIREYFRKQLREKNPEAWRAANRRLYEHLRDSAEKLPDTLEGLQPLYQSVAFGCQAGLPQEVFDQVYVPRILRGEQFYSWRKLGIFGSDLGATASFFERPWSRIAKEMSEPAKTLLLNYAAFCLRAVGRLGEALEPMRAGLQMHVRQKVWSSAAITASNLSELELSLGDLTAAIRDAKESVAHADRSGDEFQRMGTRTTLADALNQAGLRADAESSFRNAEQMQSERQPKYPWLYSLEGFQYCDLLLAEAERAAWQTILAYGNSLTSETTDHSLLYETCSSVSQRAKKMFDWRQPTDSLLDIALDHLTLGRAGLYASIIDPALIGNRQLANENLDAAVDVLRRAGTMDHFTRPLLSRAWLRFLEGDAESARTDLDEAWEIAERGPMKLFMADIHLYRARLFHGVKPYPWTSPQEELAAARKLIEQCGYWRRKEELEDAEAAAKNW